MSAVKVKLTDSAIAAATHPKRSSRENATCEPMTSPTGGGLRPDADDGARSAVEAFFGDLLDDVALEAPVSRARLVRALAAVQAVAADRRSGVRDDASAAITTLGGASIVPVPASTWSDLAREAGLTATDEVAARAAHRRLAVAAADLRLPEGSDPLVVLPPS